MISDTSDAVETPFGGLTWRAETATDTAFLTRLHDSVRAAEFAPIPEPARRQLLDMQFRAMNSGYRAQYPAGRFAIVVLDGNPIGRLITDDQPELFQIVYIALLPEWRRRGLATALMRAVLEGPRQRGVRCAATVAPGNVASIRLWAGLGFVETRRGDTDLVMEWRPG